MTWQLYTAVSVLTLSISVILQRILIHKDKADPYAYAVVFQGMVGAVITALVVFRGFDFTGLNTVLIPAIISMVLYGAGHVLYAKTLQKVEASVFSIFFASQAVWIMLLGILWFHEKLTFLQVAGSALIFASILLLVRRASLRKFDKGAALGLLTGLVFGFAITCWSYVGRHTDILTWAAISFAGTSLSAWLLYPGATKRMAPLFRGETLLKMLVLSVFYAVGCTCMLYAYKLGTFSVVSPLRQTSIIVTVLLALAVLRAERDQFRRKILAASICTLGVVLIVA